ncbi:MAG: GNAT family N-acetyltransferase [Acidimicrobiia bacterium]|nr:GNAT family N-acetyltransferase [Acidimicrobiia bacterium]
MAVTVRPANQTDLPALTAIDLSYTIHRLLSLERSGQAPELTFQFRWDATEPREGLYDELDVDGLRVALDRTDLFLVASVESECAGYLMLVLPDYTDAGEITDLAVHRPLRDRGVGRALVEAAVTWAQERGLRALWVEPGAEMARAIEFYLSMGFRISGFNDRMYSNQDEEPPTIYMYLDL